MNLNQYKVKVKYLPTNRFRTISLWAINEADARRRISEEPQFADYSEIKGITLASVYKPYPDKINYAISLGIKITPDMSNDDVSALISRRLDDKWEPKIGLKDFATAHYIPFSLYIGKKALYNIVFYHLDLESRIAFFIFSVYRYLSNDRESNLDKSPYRNLFYQAAHNWKDNASIVKSLDSNYNGEDLRFLGQYMSPVAVMHVVAVKTLWFIKKQCSFYWKRILFQRQILIGHLFLETITLAIPIPLLKQFRALKPLRIPALFPSQVTIRLKRILILIVIRVIVNSS